MRRPDEKITRSARKRIYNRIVKEIKSKGVDSAVWAEAYAEGGGDKEKTRAAYIRLRAEELYDDELYKKTSEYAENLMGEKGFVKRDPSSNKRPSEQGDDGAQSQRLNIEIKGGTPSEGPSGVAGWLALLVALLLVVAPIFVLGQAAVFVGELGEVRDASRIPLDIGGIVTVLWLVSVISAVAYFYAGLRLMGFRRHSSELPGFYWVKEVVAIIWLAGPFMDVVFIWYIASSNNEFVRNLSGPWMFEGVLSSIFWASVWTAYLLMSKRVGNTFPKHSVGDVR